ncbi:MAG TPA: hypothetical protein PK854_05075 [Oscillospiraceae bacterium]|nr:hypothetical protein [Oscillospiraceae bacterium]
MDNEYKQSEYFVGYLDILGYKELFTRHKDKTDEFLFAINEAFKETKNEEKSSSKLNQIVKPEIKIFSDNIVIAFKCKYEISDYVLFLGLIRLMAKIQFKFCIKYGLILRGCISKGLFYINENLVFGEALIKSYEAERTACFPRIILENDYIEKILVFINSEAQGERNILIRNNASALFQLYVLLDSDGKYFINYMPIYPRDILMDNVKIQNYFLRNYTEPSQTFIEYFGVNFDNKEQILKHKDLLIEKIMEYGNYKDIDSTDIKKIDERRKVLLKYMWLVEYHNKACEIIDLNDYKINYKLEMDPLSHEPTVMVKTSELVDTI